jgi:hypothetical protein
MHYYMPDELNKTGSSHLGRKSTTKELRKQIELTRYIAVVSQLIKLSSLTPFTGIHKSKC